MTAINYVRDLPGGGVVAARGAPHPGLGAAHGYCSQASAPPVGTAVRPRRRPPYRWWWGFGSMRSCLSACKAACRGP